MTLQKSVGTAVRDGNAATAVTFTSVAANTLLALFCHADSDDGNATESLSISADGGLTWTKNVQANGSPGAVVAIFTAPCAAGSSSITASVADSRGNKDKSVLPVKLTDDNGGIPGVGKTSTANPATFTSTAAGSWMWGVGLGSDSGTPTETGQTIEDFLGSNSFNDGDNIQTYSLNAKSTASGQTMSMSFPSPLHDAAVEILAGTGGGSTDHPGAVAPTVTATLAPAATHTRAAATSGTAAATLAPTPHQGHAAAVSSAVTVGLTPAATHIRGAAIAAAAAATLAPSAHQDHTAATTATVTATLAAAATPVHPAAVTADVLPALFLSPSGHNQGAITADITATLEAAETHTRAAAVALHAVAGLITAASSVGAHAISSTVIARMAATILANIVRDITVTYGQPELAWAFGPPELAWHLGTVET